MHLPNCYFEKDMPNCKIAQAHVLRTYSVDVINHTFTHIETYRNNFLIHKSFAEVLLKENAIPKNTLRPALIVKKRKKDLKKALSKPLTSNIEHNEYAPLIPFYLIANGCWVSDEYELLSYDKAVTENNLFKNELNKEELLKEKTKGVVIANCIDSDKIILCDDGKVIRFSHEDLTAIEEWPSLPMFIVAAINEQ